MPEHNYRQHDVGEESRLQSPCHKHDIGHDEHRRQRSNGAFLAPVQSAANEAEQPVEWQANDGDERLTAE